MQPTVTCGIGCGGSPCSRFATLRANGHSTPGRQPRDLLRPLCPGNIARTSVRAHGDGGGGNGRNGVPGAEL